MQEYTITINNDSTKVRTTNELIAVLDVLQGNYDTEVLKQLQSDLANIVLTAKDFQNITKVLSAENQVFLIQSLGSNMVTILQRHAPLRDFLATTSHESVELALIETLNKSGLQELISDALQLSEVLEWVYGRCDELLLNTIGTDYIKNIARSGYDFSLILQSISHEMQLKLINKTGWDFLAGIIINSKDFAYLMRALPMHLSKQLIELLGKEKLSKLIQSAKELQSVHRFLETEEQTLLDTYFNF